MQTHSTAALTVAYSALLLTACDDRSTSPTALPPADPAALQLVAEPFTARAPIDPYFINQAPDFLIRSTVRTDLVIQRLVFPAGPLPWHTHPGPSFAIVEQGQVMLTRFTKDGCITAVYGPGDTYYEVADQVHQATYLGTENVEYKVRFNTPVGDPLSTPAADPGC